MTFNALNIDENDVNPNCVNRFTGGRVVAPVNNSELLGEPLLCAYCKQPARTQKNHDAHEKRCQMKEEKEKRDQMLSVVTEAVTEGVKQGVAEAIKQLLPALTQIQHESNTQEVRNEPGVVSGGAGADRPAPRRRGRPRNQPLLDHPQEPAEQ